VPPRFGMPPRNTEAPPPGLYTPDWAPDRTQICTPVTATTTLGALKELNEAYKSGAHMVELRADYINGLVPKTDLKNLIEAAQLPLIVTCRPAWEGGQYEGPEQERLEILKTAAELGADYIDVEFQVVRDFLQMCIPPEGVKLIISYHDFDKTPTDDSLNRLVADMHAVGCHVVKIAAMANDISDSMRMLQLLERQNGRATVALSMGERGLPARILAPKYGGYITFGALHAGAESAPGQPTVQELRDVYRVHLQTPDTKVYGVIGNPVSHSRSPALHNAALEAAGLDAVYLPLLVDDLPRFLESFDAPAFSGFSVTLPHKAAALAAVAESKADPLAKQIGAANTLVRRRDGSLAAFNTDCPAALSAIEMGVLQHQAEAEGISTEGIQEALEQVVQRGLQSPLEGSTVLVIGAGGAGRALAFGAAERGAKVLIANRSREKADELAAAVGSAASVVTLEDVNAGRVKADVLANSTSVGMHPNVDQTPVAAAAMSNFTVVFDAVYTPLETQLLKDAKAAGCTTVSGLEMFVGQAADQFRLFTGQTAPVKLMRRVTLESLAGQT